MQRDPEAVDMNSPEKITLVVFRELVHYIMVFVQPGVPISREKKNVAKSEIYYFLLCQDILREVVPFRGRKFSVVTNLRYDSLHT